MTTKRVALWRVCAVAVAIASAICLGDEVLQQISPLPTEYFPLFQFVTMRWSGSGDVTAPLRAVEVELPAEGASTSGCEVSDFSGFPPGSIALLRQGTCDFSLKAQNAVGAGAVGAIIIMDSQSLRGTLSAPGVSIPVVGTTPDVGENLNDLIQAGEVVIHMFVAPNVLSPAKMWVGLKNSAAVGLRFDVKVDVFDDGGLLATGFLDNQSAGSRGFDNALLKTIELVSGDSSGYPYDQGTLSVTISVRKSCSERGHNSGAVRFWYNGQPTDAGPTRDAGSRIDARLDSRLSSGDYFLRENSILDLTAGSTRLAADAFLNSRFACPGRPYQELGTWGLLPTPTPTPGSPCPICPTPTTTPAPAGGGTLKPIPR